MNGQASRTSRIIGSLTILACLAFAVPTFGGEEIEYMGSEFCAQCHASYYNDFRQSGHPYKLVSAEEAQLRPIPLPAGYSWDDISYVIGGYKWKSRYMGLDGYIITTTDQDGDGTFETEGINQWNYLTRNWTNYHAGEVTPYNCGSCHTTGWVADDDWEFDGDLSDNQDNRPGIHGTFAFGGIQCEACHGPFVGFPDHVTGGMAADTSSEACGQCHIRGSSATIPASGGFIRHHEQWNEQLASPHAGLDCVDCHDPHKQSALSVKVACSDCHAVQAAAYADTVMDRWGVSCEDCHMPMATRSATAQGPFRGDVMTHLFTIDTDPWASMFNEAGNFVELDGNGKASVTLDFACLSCHRAETMTWASFYAKNFHSSSSTPDVRNPGLIRFRGIFH